MNEIESRVVLGARVDAPSYIEATLLILEWAINAQSRYVCFANVHVIMESYDEPRFRSVINQADLVTPDGVPVVLALRLLGIKSASQCCGPHLMPALLSAAEIAGISVGFYGGSQDTLHKLIDTVNTMWPRLRVAYAHSPPFRSATCDEDARETDRINRSDTRILFVGLGCPKQELWAASHRGEVNAVMLAVGAAFDFLAGTKPNVPPLLRHFGLEWLFRLGSEPRRLWRRYAYHNPRFVVQFARQLWHSVRWRSIR